MMKNSEESEKTHAQIRRFTRSNTKKRICMRTLQWEGSWAGFGIRNGAVTRTVELGEEIRRRRGFTEIKKWRWKKKGGKQTDIYTRGEKWKIKINIKYKENGVQLFTLRLQQSATSGAPNLVTPKFIRRRIKVNWRKVKRKDVHRRQKDLANIFNITKIWGVVVIYEFVKIS